VALMAATWGLAYGSPQEGPDLDAVAAHARDRGLPEDIVAQAVALLHSHLPYVIDEAVRTSAEAGAPLPPWLARWVPDGDREDKEGLEPCDLDEDDFDEDDEALEPGPSEDPESDLDHPEGL
jgi:hypothetical protein